MRAHPGSSRRVGTPIDLPADLSFVGDEGRNLARVPGANRPVVGEVLIAGTPAALVVGRGRRPG